MTRYTMDFNVGSLNSSTVFWVPISSFNHAQGHPNMNHNPPLITWQFDGSWTNVVKTTSLSNKLWLRLYWAKKSLMLVVMVRQGVASAHLYPDPWWLIGLVMVFWLLGWLVLVFDWKWQCVSGKTDNRINWMTVLEMPCCVVKKKRKFFNVYVAQIWVEFDCWCRICL